MLIGLTIGALGALLGLGQLMMRTQSGADPATALNLIPVIPPDLEERLVWLPDDPLDGLLAEPQRALDPNTRELITGAYLRAWAQWGIALEIGQPYGLTSYFSGPALAGVTRNVTQTVASGWTIRQSNLQHELALHYYADDGSIVAFTDRNVQLVQQFLPQNRAQTAGEAASYVLQSSHRYAIVMLLEDGNWRLYQWVRIGDGEPSARRAEVVPNTAPIPPATMATIQEGKVHVAGRPLPIAGINYYPQAAPWTTFWPAYDPQQITVDLQRIRALGLNTVRIFLSYTDFGGTVVTAQRRAQLADFLGRADAAGLKVLVTLFDHHTDHHPATWAADARHLATLVPYFAEHPAILAWDLKNEPDRDYAYNTQPLVDEWLRFIARNVRRHDANHLITIGWSTPEAAVALSDEVDFVAYHYFDEPTAYQARIAALQSAVGTKPILLEEFTFSTWNSPFYPGHTELEQAHYYAAMLNAHQAVDSLGYLVWTLYDFDTVPLAEFRYPWQRGMQANMGLLRRDGTAKMAATLVNPKTPRNLTPLTVWQQFAKPFWGTLAGLLLLSLVLLRWRWQRPPHQSRS